jgi:hypothetical protein
LKEGGHRVEAGGSPGDSISLGLSPRLPLTVLVAPLTTNAQPPKKGHRIGVPQQCERALGSTPFGGLLRQGLRAISAGRRGREPVIEYRSAEGHDERLPALAAELVQLQGR